MFDTLLIDAQDMAVKRLSKNSKEGLGELKNEVITIANLHHCNPVKLLDCCLEDEERNFQFMNTCLTKSLNNFIFDMDFS